MKLTKKTIELICELERIVGDSCYNPKSLNGYTLEEGLSFRYPVIYVDKDKSVRKNRYKINDINKDGINTMHYQFGSNHLYIGSAINQILEHLEKEYNLNFDELVKQKK